MILEEAIPDGHALTRPSDSRKQVGDEVAQ
jgi:hypothetical protein